MNVTNRKQSALTRNRTSGSSAKWLSIFIVAAGVGCFTPVVTGTPAGAGRGSRASATEVFAIDPMVLSGFTSQFFGSHPAVRDATGG